MSNRKKKQKKKKTKKKETERSTIGVGLFIKVNTKLFELRMMPSSYQEPVNTVFLRTLQHNLSDMFIDRRLSPNYKNVMTLFVKN